MVATQEVEPAAVEQALAAGGLLVGPSNMPSAKEPLYSADILPYAGGTAPSAVKPMLTTKTHCPSMEKLETVQGALVVVAQCNTPCVEPSMVVTLW